MSEQPKKNHLFWLGIRLGTYSGITFLTAIAAHIPTLAPASLFIIGGYGLYMLWGTVRHYVALSKDHYVQSRAKFLWLKAFTIDINDYGFYILAVLVGMYVILGV